MLIQPIANQLHYRNYQQQRVNKNTSFKGELGAKVLTEIAGSATKDSNAIKNVLEKLGIGFLGLVSLSTLRDVLESVFEKKADLEKELESKKQVFEDDKKAEEVLLEAKKQAFENETKAKVEELNKKSEELAVKEKELEKKEQTLINTANIMKESEIESIKSATRAFYGIKDNELTSYDSIGEQCLELSSVFSKLKTVDIKNLNSNTLQQLAVAMRNNEGRFTKETLDFLSRIVSMHNFDINDLITTMTLVKDNTGNIDMEKSTHFIALYSLKSSDMSSVNEEIAKFYISPSEKYSISDAQILFKLLGVQSKIDNEGLIINGDLYLGLSQSRDHSRMYKKCENLNINLNELLKNVVQVNGYFSISRNKQITALPRLKYICGDARFDYTSITEIPNLVSIEGNADFSYSQIRNLPKLVSIIGKRYYDYSPLEEKKDWQKSITG